MSTFSTRLRYLRVAAKLSQQDLATILKISKSSVNMYERGEREPGFETLEAIADYFNVDMNYLLGQSDTPRVVSFDINGNRSPSLPAGFEPLPVTRMVPLYNAIACGTPIFADSNVETMVPMPENIKADFAVRCKGDSMTGARIMDGDLVFIRKQPTVENGEIAAILVGEEATLKRFYQYGDTVVLRAENPSFKELTFSGAALDDIQIMGKAVAFLSAVS